MSHVHFNGLKQHIKLRQSDLLCKNVGILLGVVSDCEELVGVTSTDHESNSFSLLHEFEEHSP